MKGLGDAADQARYCILGVPAHVTRDVLHQYFSNNYGPVVHVSIDRGTAYIIMADDTSREAMVTEKHNIGGKLLRACISKESLHTADVKKVHLGNLPETCNPGHVRGACTKYGVVLDVHLPKDPRTGQRRNFGFVTFSTDEAFEASIEEGMVMIEGCEVTIKAASQTTGEGMSLQARKRAGTKYFVPKLPTSITDEELGDYFSRFGQVVEAGVAVDKETGQSRGFGYFTMADASSQEDLFALDHELAGEPISVLLTKESLARYGMYKVHLSNLPAEATADDIRAALCQFGMVLDVHTPKNRDGGRQNYGFVTFSSSEAFHAAVGAKRCQLGRDEVMIKPAAESAGADEEMGHHSGYPPQGYGGREEPSYGSRSGKGADHHQAARPMSLRDRKEAGVKYFVPGLPTHVTDEELHRHFARFGEVVDAAIVVDKETNQSREFGYVTMADASSQERLLTKTHWLGGKEITLMVTKESLAKLGYKIHLGELDSMISPEALKETFSQFGLVVDVHTPRDPKTGERKNFGFVTFSSPDAFREALSRGSILVQGARVQIKAAADSAGLVEEVGAAPAAMEYRGKGGPPARGGSEDYVLGDSAWGRNLEDEFWGWWMQKGKSFLKGKADMLGGKGAPRSEEASYQTRRYREEDPYNGYSAQREPRGRHFEAYEPYEASGRYEGSSRYEGGGRYEATQPAHRYEGGGSWGKGHAKGHAKGPAKGPPQGAGWKGKGPGQARFSPY